MCPNFTGTGSRYFTRRIFFLRSSHSSPSFSSGFEVAAPVTRTLLCCQNVRPQSQIQWRADPNFTRIRVGRRDIILRRDISALAAEILERLGALGSGGESGAGNRQSAFHVTIAGAPEIFARRSRRGGMIASLLDDIYLGTHP